MKAMVIGCGRLGAELAIRLDQRGHDVSIIDLNEAAYGKVPPEFRGRFFEGDALNRDVMRRAGIQQTNSLAVVTDSDVLNATIGHIATEVYHVPNVVVRNYDPRYRILHETYELQVVSALNWGAQRIEEMMYHSDMRVVFSAGNGEVEVYEIAIPDGWAGKTLIDLMDSEQCIPVALTRAGKAILPESALLLKAGDVLHVSATLEGVQSLRKRIHSPVASGKEGR